MQDSVELASIQFTHQLWSKVILPERMIERHYSAPTIHRKRCACRVGIITVPECPEIALILDLAASSAWSICTKTLRNREC